MRRGDFNDLVAARPYKSFDPPRAREKISGSERAGAEARVHNARDQRACSKENDTIVATIAVLALTSLAQAQERTISRWRHTLSISANAMITFQSIHSAVAPYGSRSIRGQRLGTRGVGRYMRRTHKCLRVLLSSTRLHRSI